MPVIFHIDVNSAYLSWTAVEELKNGAGRDLREIPSIIGGDQKSRHGVVLAKSIPAKKYGIRTGEPVANAFRKCPGLVMEPPDHKLYRRYSEGLMAFLKSYTPVIEQVSVDECYMDFTERARDYHSPVEGAMEIKNEVYRRFGFTVNVGISDNKLLAKMAGDFEKPDKVHTLFPGEIQEKLWPLPVGELFSVGGASEQKLKRLGIMTIGDLAQADLGTLQATLKKHGEAIWNYANGRDFSLVEAERADNKGYGNSVTLSYDVTRAEEAKQVLLSLAETVGRRLRRDGAWIEVVSVTLRFFDLTNASHQCVLEHATNITDEIYQAACRLFDEFWDRTPIRLIGIQTGKVTKEGDNRQLSLFDDTDYEKLERLDRAMDSIREKFGADAVRRASFLQKDRPDI